MLLSQDSCRNASHDGVAELPQRVDHHMRQLRIRPKPLHNVAVVEIDRQLEPLSWEIEYKLTVPIHHE
jgi:hypothetical protein